METTGALPIHSLSDPSLYLNRGLSLLAFQRRVLSEAEDIRNPLLERVKFLSILNSNLDEFFMVRVAALKQQVLSGVQELSLDGRSPAEQLTGIRTEVEALIEDAYRCWRDQIYPELKHAGVHVENHDTLSPAEQKVLGEYFEATVLPVLTPLGFDPGRPFPHISNVSLNLAIMLKDKAGVSHFARIKVPDTLPQLVAVPSAADRFVWLEQVIVANLQVLFPGLTIVEAYPFRVIRDAEIEIQELESGDLLETVEEAVWRRRFRGAVALQVDCAMPANMLSVLAENLPAKPEDIYTADGPLDFKRLWQLQSLDLPHLKHKSFAPAVPHALKREMEEDFFGLIRREDILLHHPYESFQPVVDFLRAAARDPDVLTIKMTLYRVGRNSPIVQALLDAIQEGKQVAVLLELKARFDEESNIEWARALEHEGVHVVYGLQGLKVHSKIALVVRREGGVMRKYVHLGTGNYNAATARLYTDLSMFTADEQIGHDAVALFNRLTGYSGTIAFNKLLVAPLGLRSGLEKLIDREIALSEQGADGHIIAKINALDDPGMIEALYRASRAGVRIDLLVRGICSLRPGVAGVSENIRVTSIVGRFLEHSRIYYFRNGGQEEVFVGSADLMPRNLNHRIEVIFPVQNPKLIRRLKDEILELYLTDNVNARYLQSDGSYPRRHRDEAAKLVDSQGDQISLLCEAR